MFYLPDKDGQGLVEYALLLMLIAIVLIVLVAIFGEQVNSMYSTFLSAWP